MNKPDAPGKLPVPVKATIRGALGEFMATVLDLSPLGIELLSSRPISLNERIGMTLRCDAIRGPGLSISGDVQVCREESGSTHYVKVTFDHVGDSEKRLQTFLWDLEEAGRKRRKR